MLFKLRDVPEDEAAEVRELLEENGVAFYETPASRWGVSMEAIWLQDEAQLERARGLIAQYQQERSHRLHEEYEQLKAEGRQETLMDRIRAQPLMFLFYLGLALFIVYFSIMPFFSMGRG